MTYVTAEQMLISALINSQDALSARTYGMTPEYIEGYPAEYAWLLNYVETYHDQPSPEIFGEAFPEFRLGSHDNVRAAVDPASRAPRETPDDHRDDQGLRDARRG